MMSEFDVIVIGREMLYLSVLLTAPAVGVSLLIGLLVSVLQTLTSIQEQTLTFAPRIIAVAIVLVMTLPWMLEELVRFTASMIARIGQITL